MLVVLAMVGEGDLISRGFVVLNSWKEPGGMEASPGDR